MKRRHVEIRSHIRTRCPYLARRPILEHRFLDDLNLAAAALELGPVAFVLKRSGGQELLQAIEQILLGRSYMTPKLKVGDWVAAKARARQFSRDLTKRQRDIVQLFAEGRPMKEIAAILSLSEKTVEFHKHHIMETFNIKSNADLVLFGLKHGLIAVNPESSTIPTNGTMRILNPRR